MDSRRVHGAEYRIVGIDTIVPTIYRYAQENYGVIIIDKDSFNEYQIVNIYDLVVENTVSKYSSTWKGSNIPQEIEKICIGYDEDGNGRIEEDEYGIKQYIEKTLGSVPDNAEDMDDFKKLFGVNNITSDEGIYKIKNPTSVSCPWTASTYNIMQRIKVDMEGNSYNFGGPGKQTYTGAFYSTDSNKSGFIKKYKSNTFKEYYYAVKTTNNLTEEQETDRIQIIYVKE